IIALLVDDVASLAGHLVHAIAALAGALAEIVTGFVARGRREQERYCRADGRTNHEREQYTRRSNALILCHGPLPVDPSEQTDLHFQVPSLILVDIGDQIPDLHHGAVYVLIQRFVL